ncbi:hypothetical protein PAEPH01_0675 [Pancytospora epiphaga]|nr:hypothetical protein PAEPH01_0675 [Pancytospora epiphaga]
MSKIKFKDQKLLQKLLQVFTEHRQITFEINPSIMKISSLSSPFMYLTMNNDFFNSDSTLMFSINTKELLYSLKLLEADFVIVMDTFKMVRNSEDPQNQEIIAGPQTVPEKKLIYAYIEIPLTQPIIPFYQNLEKYSTKFFIGKNSLKGLLRGLVSYSNEDKLILRKSISGTKETMEIEVEYLEKGDLYFHCSNDWVAGLVPLLDLISAILFCFTDGMLLVRVQIQIPNSRGVHLEVQVPERVYAK